MRQRGTQFGFTFAETALTMAFLAIGAGAAAPSVASHMQRNRVERATFDIVALERRLDEYRQHHHELPDSLDQLNPAVPLDPWGHAYEYVNFATRGLSEQRSYHNLPVNSDYDLYSRGSDGLTEVGLNDDVARDDIVRAGDGDFVGLAANF